MHRIQIIINMGKQVKVKVPTQHKLEWRNKTTTNLSQVAQCSPAMKMCFIPLYTKRKLVTETISMTVH
jgi:hypothetical protein